MTVGHLVLIAVAAWLAVSAAIAPFVMRYDNGHWGRSSRWYETGFMSAWGLSLFWTAVAAVAGVGLAVLMMIFVDLFNTPI